MKKCNKGFGDIDDRATKCPHCGANQKPVVRFWLGAILIILAAILVGAPFIASLFQIP